MVLKKYTLFITEHEKGVSRATVYRFKKHRSHFGWSTIILLRDTAGHEQNNSMVYKLTCTWPRAFFMWMFWKYFQCADIYKNWEERAAYIRLQKIGQCWSTFASCNKKKGRWNMYKKFLKCTRQLDAGQVAYFNCGASEQLFWFQF
jgi:hypothetical protein